MAKEEGWELSQLLNSNKAVVVGGNAPRQLLSLHSIHVLWLGFRVKVRVRVRGGVRARV